MENVIPPTYKHLTPFKRCVLQNFPFIEADFDALTNYGLLCKVVKYLNDVINSQNEVQTNMEILNNAFIELKSYVDNYFKNLDVQEEINNKLDAMVEDGSLQTIISNLYLGEIEFIFPKFENGEGSGDYSLLKTPSKNIMFDCNASSRWTTVNKMLTSNNVNHIDVLIISHYDGDHYQNVYNLIQYGYLDNDSIVYLPCIPDTYSQEYIDAGLECKAWLDAGNIPYEYPTEGEIKTIDSDVDLSIEFANTDKTVIDNYPNKWNNNASMVCFIKHKNVNSFIGGDAQYIVYNYLYSQGYPKAPVALYKLSHHGYEFDTSINFVEQLSPKYGVISLQGNETFIDAGTSYTKECSLITALGGELYASYDQTDYIRFRSNGESMNCISGKRMTVSNGMPVYHFYVNSTSLKNKIQDGTQDHPYSEVVQALGRIPMTKNCEVYIHIADGQYNYFNNSPATKNRLRIAGGKNCIIHLQGNSEDNTAVMLNDVYVENSILYLENLSVDSLEFAGISAMYSDVYMNNVIVTTSDGTTSTHPGINAMNSNLYTIGNLRITNVTTGIFLQRGSQLEVDSYNGRLEFGVTTSPIEIRDSSIAITGDKVYFDNDSDKIAFTNNFLHHKAAKSIMTTHDNYATSVTLTDSVGKFDWIEIFYHTSAYIYGSTGRIYAPNGKDISLIAPNYNTDNGKLFVKQTKVHLGGDTLTLSNGGQFTIDGTNIPSFSTNNAFFNVVKVVGGYKDYIDEV